MIDYLKESTFVVNDVISDAWDVLKKRYLAIAGICFSLFIVSNISGILAAYLSSVNILLSVFMALLFLFLYFSIQLTLFKHIFQVLDKSADQVKLRKSFPTLKEIIYFFACVLTITVGTFLVYLIISVVFFPLIYLVDIEVMVNMVYVITIILFSYTFLRIAFFPFFILDKKESPFKSIRLSLAVTRGNFVKIILIIAFFALSGSLYLYFSYRGYPFISTILSLINSFVIIPLSSVTFIIAYRKMVHDYKGDSDPSIMQNII